MKYHPLPQPDEIEVRVKEDAMGAYLIMTGVADLVYFIFSIVGAVKARKGLFYYFIFFGKMAYHQVYQVRPEQLGSMTRNQPPGL